jgi:hypothetical protein
MNTKFSKRVGVELPEIQIRIRYEAPQGLREFIPQVLYQFGYMPSYLRRIICRTIFSTPDKNNWSEFPNIENEVSHLIMECEWYKVYDIIESFWKNIDLQYRDEFQEEVNIYFRQNGIGWKMENGIIEIRGDELFETSVKNVTAALEDSNLNTAKNEISEAMTDLSRKPQADITGAVQHSVACLECVSREITGDKKSTLGDIIKKNPGIVPAPLDKAIEKIWGYTSEQGRHLREGQTPSFEEAELVVELTAAISIYLAKKLPVHPDTEDPFAY